MPGRSAFTLRCSVQRVPFYRRIAGRSSKGKAVVATAAKLARAIYTILKNQCPFRDAGEEAYEEHYKQRVINNLRRRATRLGLVLVPAEPAPGGAPSMV